MDPGNSKVKSVCSSTAGRDQGSPEVGILKAVGSEIKDFLELGFWILWSQKSKSEVIIIRAVFWTI